MFEKRITHSELSAYRVVRAQSEYDLERIAAAQIAIWNDRWKRKQEADRNRESRTNSLKARALNATQAATAKSLALEQTKELEAERNYLENLLQPALSRDARIDWEAKKTHVRFPVSRPSPSQAIPLPNLPDQTNSLYNPKPLQPKFNFIDRILAVRKLKKIEEVEKLNGDAVAKAKTAFDVALQVWSEKKEGVETANLELSKRFDIELKRWKTQKSEFEAQQEARNKEIDCQRSAYEAKDQDAINTYLEDVLSQSEYPDTFPQEHYFEYKSSTGNLVLDYELPSRDVMPSVKDVKYIASRSEFQKSSVPDTWVKKTYDEMLYQIVLRTLYEMFQSDSCDALVSVVFNGWVRSVDRATGSLVHACVMSIEARKDEFLAINLDRVDPKACFKKLKGVSASKLIELSPIKPIVTLNREDRRFVEGYDVAESLDERTNLASMDWMDFENLIREVFEKEFSKGGGEVHITQASRDGGVDAVAFDPDPIRGGKIVIQAKRYTNTVAVSAVRDLYGTVHNEGANKGILVTTSDFGPDAYAFAKDKPLTLLSGAELLYLLGQHGHAAKIDLAEAKRLAAQAL